MQNTLQRGDVNMKEKDMKMSILLDYYGNILTDNQRDVLELYYNEDLSLAEIAEHSNISRQGVRDSIKRGEQFMCELEDKLGLIKRISLLEGTVDRMSALADDIIDINAETLMSRMIESKAREIKDAAAEVAE